MTYHGGVLLHRTPEIRGYRVRFASTSLKVSMFIFGQGRLSDLFWNLRAEPHQRQGTINVHSLMEFLKRFYDVRNYRDQKILLLIYMVVGNYFIPKFSQNKR